MPKVQKEIIEPNDVETLYYAISLVEQTGVAWSVPGWITGAYRSRFVISAELNLFIRI
ncbi:hypothetical protein R3C64_000707 [Salmonella enterica]|nr:hypothetical protein [Salmonella enterica]ELJ9674865.1 hypothetical protein [Salmonella enterica]ELQ9129320.1 hypothetical protein [Salmonella enterica]